jgi:putative tryptophan/tyrosine transport system substrate-binding protein
MAADFHGLNLSRRRFVQGAGLAGLGLLAGCGRWPGQAPASAQVPKVGIMNAIPSSAEAFRQGMAALGYVDGQNIILEYRSVGAREELLPEAAAELARLPVDVIVAGGDPPIRAAVEATTTIPIVMAVSRDPVASGFITSLAHPGANITGLSYLSVQLTGKRLELLQQTVSRSARVVALGPPSALPEWREAEDASRALGLQLQFLEVHRPDDLAEAIEGAIRDGSDALLVLGSPLTAGQHWRIAELAVANRLPAIYDRREFAEAGGLMAYGPRITGLWSRSAYYVDRILKGTKPADLPVEQPREFDFVINLKTAQALGLTIPQHVLLQATEVIQ